MRFVLVTNIAEHKVATAVSAVENTAQLFIVIQERVGFVHEKRGRPLVDRTEGNRRR